MKRNLDLIRTILLRIEALDSYSYKITNESFYDLCADENLLSLHIELLLEADYIEVVDVIYIGVAKDFLIRRLTMQGYDYLDSVRSDNIWANTKRRLADVGGSASLEIVKELAIHIAKGLLGL